jgi:hypothetical protein
MTLAWTNATASTTATTAVQNARQKAWASLAPPPPSAMPALLFEFTT